LYMPFVFYFITDTFPSVAGCNILWILSYYSKREMQVN
jgi:hypothetical protein